MADYHPTEIIDMIMILGESRNNYAAAARLYAERYPNRKHPSNVTIQILTQRVRIEMELLLVNADIINTTKMIRVITILAMIHLDPHISSRQVEKETGIPQSTVI